MAWFGKKEVISKVGVYDADGTKGVVPELTRPRWSKWNGRLGEEPPYDAKVTQQLYQKMGFVTGAIDKIVDFVIGAGINTRCVNVRAKKVIDDWRRSVDFDYWLRRWFREALITPVGIMELGGDKQTDTVKGVKVLNSRYLFVERDVTGKEKVWRQYTGDVGRYDVNSKVIEFLPFQIAALRINQVGDDAYGVGIIYPALPFINNLLASEKDLHLIMKRKAGSPTHVKVGNADKGIVPSASAVSDFGKKLETMNARTEWVTDCYVDIKPVDYGNVAGRFETVLNHDEDMMMFTFQVPEVLMGRGNIPEGLAKVQLDAFERKAKSYQSEIEKVVEDQIFKRVLNANGLNDKVEIEWGAPSDDVRQRRIQNISMILGNSMLAPDLRVALERELATLLELDVKDLSFEREQEENEELPKVPVPSQGLKKKCSCGLEMDGTDDLTVKEWLGFNFKDFLGSILDAVSKDDFYELKAESQEQIDAGLLTDPQLEKLRGVLDDGFKNNWSIRKLSDEISKNVGLKDRYVLDDNDHILRASDGSPVLAMPANGRSPVIARTETVRLANLGGLNYYDDAGIKQVEWVSAVSERTCEFCQEQNGKVLGIDEAFGLIPAHVMCRCTFAPVTRLRGT